MRQTDSAMRMLISAYKAVLANCYIKETLVGGVKRFCKGVALSSFLTTVLAGISTSSFATDLNPITDSFNNDYTDSVEINAGDVSAIELKEDGNKTVEIKTSNSDDGSITLNSEKYGIRDDSAGNNITINAAQNNVIKVTGEASVDSGDGINLTANATGSVSLTAKGNNDINTTDDGIYVDAGSKSKVSLTASENGNNKIVSGNNAIDFRGSESVSLTAVNGNNFLETTKGDGLRNTGSGEITVTGLSNDISTGDNGIQVGDSNSSASGKVTVTANNGYNKITAGANGIEVTDSAENIEINVSANGYNVIQGDVDGVKLGGSGTVTVSALANNTDTNIALLSNEDEDVPYNNYFFGEENGIHRVDGSEVIFNATADNNNYISGGNNGILAEGVADSGEIPSISITANNGSNIIGFETFTDDNGEHVGQIGENGIKVTSGSVSLNAGESNIINATNIGVLSQDSVNITAKQDNIIKGEQIAGVNTKNGGSTVIESTDGSNNIYGGKQGVWLDGSSGKTVVNIVAKGNNIISEKKDNEPLGSGINSNNSELTVESKYGNNEISGGDSAVLGTLSSNIIINAYNSNIISADRQFGVDAIYSSNIIMNAGRNELVAERAISAEGGSSIEIYANNNVTDAVERDNYIKAKYYDGSAYGINARSSSKVVLSALYGDNTIESDNYGIYAVNEQTAVDLNAKGNSVSSKEYGIYLQKNASINLNATHNDNYVSGVNYGLIVYSSSIASLDALSGYNIIYSSNGVGIRSDALESNSILDAMGNNIEGKTYGIRASNFSIVSLNAFNYNNEVSSQQYGIYSYSGANVSLNSEIGNNIVYGKTDGVVANNGIVYLNANLNNEISTENFAVHGYSQAKITLDANINKLTANDITDVYAHSNYGNRYAIYSLSGSSVILDAGNQNSLLGAVYAEGANTSVSLTGKSNTVSSYAQSSSLGDLSDEPAFAGKKVISALYAEEGANISITGDSNILRTYAEYDNDEQLERVVWAYNGKEGEKKGSSISIDGYSYISTDSYEKSPNSLDVAIAAGTATKLDFNTVNKEVNPDDRAKVTVTYADIKDEEGHLQHSFISGDILAAYEGLIYITPKDGSAGITINGNLLAGNNGIVNVDLGQGGILTGRADDYGDAGVLDNSKHTEFFNPAFSSTIFKGGEVNLTMGEGSRWNVTGQSWITRINASQNAITKNSPMIDLISSNTDRNEAAHALTVYELTGNAIFNMSLDADRDVSDMLYIKNADGEYTVNVIDAVSHDDMYADGLDGLRFATVGAGSKAKFRALTYNGGGVNNIEYQIGTDAYAGNDENSVYNGDNMSEHKPGDSTVDKFFESSGKPGEAITAPATKTLSLAAVNVLVLAVDSEATVLVEEETAAPAAESGLDEVTNFKLVGVESSEISDAGKTIVDMSRANYANAVYMDTLNKRQGEARFVGSTDHGVWVRLRHDNIGKDDSFRTHDTMVEVGFDQRDIVDSGEFHTGFALDYMNGQIDYHTVDGDGDIERYGIWFYTTYLGNDGQYADLVLKYGHLKNDFDFNLDMTGVNVNGDYTNEVASISAEYGWKFSNSYNYYIEPQVQLQYSYVTGADYTTSYGTKVDLDSIHSLIGRIGFRAGKDFKTDTPITAYIRGDVLHEFLGDQDIYAYDNTGVMDVTYENDDTWYSAGLGISVQSSENTYFFLEGEQVFGADNDNTYTVSGGFKHSF
ncbi:autotransporter outer membrane beta-barrel domain-containing protein [Succinatimonas hippei]|uniref:autotransporter outer membrane beta-barrel domain-containing protein n=1 Tax=Succinatimonas hippei TaxID=626938 RepID=UPI0026F08CEF|nr:autotransporter outer membrane beta-barrel domain-containing protein [Succinatimonas hippei]